jgi:hypothetical protein
MGWCFAIVNNRLAEIYFDKKKNGQIKIWGHCYVKREDYKTKREQGWIAQDIKKVRVAYRNKKYRLKQNKKSSIRPA